MRNKMTSKVFAILTTLLLALFAFSFTTPTLYAQEERSLPEVLLDTEEESATDEAKKASESAKKKSEKDEVQDVTRPEEEEAKREYLELFKSRPIDRITPFNFMEYAVQYAVRQGVPANTIMLILLLPFLATIVAAFRHIIGLPSLGLLVPIAFSITLLATGISAGAVLLAAILLASGFSRIVLKRLRIMQLPKMALSMLVVAIFIFVALTGSAAAGLLAVRQLSIFPILLFILLSDRIVALLLERTMVETVQITLITLIMGLLGFFLLSYEPLQRFILLYPETVFLLIPINIAIGRYFGLRLSEYFRFASVNKYGSK
jgi:hypothetical protein